MLRHKVSQVVISSLLIYYINLFYVFSGVSLFIFHGINFYGTTLFSKLSHFLCNSKPHPA